MTPRFKSELAEILDIEEGDITLDLALNGMNWDSLAVVSTAALIDEEYGKIVDGEKLNTVSSVEELMALIEAS